MVNLPGYTITMVDVPNKSPLTTRVPAYFSHIIPDKLKYPGDNSNKTTNKRQHRSFHQDTLTNGVRGGNQVEKNNISTRYPINEGSYPLSNLSFVDKIEAKLSLFHQRVNVPTYMELSFYHRQNINQGYVKHGHEQSQSDDFYYNSTTTEMEITNKTLAEEASTYLTYKIGVYIHIYWLPIMTPIGLVGNTLAFIIMVQMYNRRISCCLYMAALAVSDNVVLCSAVYYYIATVILKDSYDMTDADCEAMVYFLHVGFFTSSIIIISMTIDRYIAIKYPLKAVFYCTPRRAKMVITIAIIGSMLYNIPLTLTSRMWNSFTCAAFSTSGVLTEVLAIINIAISSIIPFCIILWFNIAIIITFRKHQSRQLQHRSTNAGSFTNTPAFASIRRETARREMYLTAMLLRVTFAFLFLTFPSQIRYAVYTFVNQYESPSAYALYVLLYNISNKCLYTNSAVNFFLYCLSGPKFRMDLQKMCCNKSEPVNYPSRQISERSVNSANSLSCNSRQNSQGSLCSVDDSINYSLQTLESSVYSVEDNSTIISTHV